MSRNIDPKKHFINIEEESEKARIRKQLNDYYNAIGGTITKEFDNQMCTFLNKFKS